MSPSFVFEPPSDEEIENLESEEEEQVDEEEDGEEDDGRGRGPKPSRHSQAPWNFAAYSNSVAEEHARRSTTSVDFKITKARQQLSVDPAADDGNESSEAEPDGQVTISHFL